MPIYEYVCAKGHQLEALVRRPEDEPHQCPKRFAQTLVGPNGEEAQKLGPPCGQPMKKVFSTPASQFPGANKW